MKRLTMTLALALMMAMPMMAERIAPETARKVAATFLTSNGAKTAQLADLTNSAGFENLYIFSTESSFVVMSADDCVKPILGYSLTGKFDADDIPDNVRWWLQGYDEEIQFAIDSKMRASMETAKQWKDMAEGNLDEAKATSVVDALIQTKWDQTKYYNNLCPAVSDGPDGYAYTGCVATAMAQIMKYHNYPTTTGIGSHSYQWGTQILSVDFGATPYDWDNMQPYYNYYYATGTADNPTWLSAPTSEQISAVATLMYHCGVSIDMSYGGRSAGGSSAFSSDVATALKEYFNYSAEIEYKKKSDYTDDEWIAMVKAELDFLRPLEYSGNGSGGHAFVCDGYDDRDYFHFNWGWSGHYDGFFTLSNLNTGANNESGSGNGSYTNGQAAIFGIQPATIGQAQAPTLSVAVIQEPGVRNAQLTWDEVANASAYRVYRNTQLIHTTVSGNETSFTDVHIPYGTSTYFIRSVDESGNLSWPSNYASATLTFHAPTNLSANSTESGVTLAWSAGENMVSYNIYCNNVLIASSINGETYTDSRLVAGTLTYFVKGVDDLGDESEASNAAQVAVAYSTPVVSDLSITLSESGGILSWTAPTWCYPTTSTATLAYGPQTVSGTSMVWDDEIVYWGHRHLAENISAHDGKKLYQVSFHASNPGTYELYVFQGTTELRDNVVIPMEQVAYQRIIVSNLGWNAIDLSEPIAINGGQDLWIFMHNPQSIDNLKSSVCTAEGINGFYYSLDLSSSTFTISGYAFLIKAFLTDGTYTYNLYDGDTKVNGNTPITETTYTVASPANNAAHRYTVKTNYYGGVSGASNMAGLSLGTASLESLSLGDNDKMTVAENGILSVGALVNGNAANLVLEDSAQLIHSSIGVKATVMKSITPYTSNDNGWNFIASPVSESITPTAENGFFPDGSIYDLYYYQESTHYWRNYKANSFDLAYQQGYLYANSAATTLQFAGTLTPSNDAASVSGLSHSAEILNGFNLVGNPFACNATIDQDCYVIEGRQVVLASGTKVFAPCEGAVVKATSDAYTVTFSKYTGAKSDIKTNSLDLAITQGKTTLDRVRVRLGKGIGMERFNLNDGDDIRLSLWQNNQDFAVAYTDGQDEMLLNFKATENGMYSIGIEDNSLDLDYLHLIDNMTGEDIDLLATPCYTFEAKTTDYVSRFRLVFSSNDASADSASDAPFAYVSHGEIIITADALAADAFDASIQVIDAMGRVIRVCTDVARNVSTQGMTSGVYVLRLIDGDHVRTQRIVIE